MVVVTKNGHNERKLFIVLRGGVQAAMRGGRLRKQAIWNFGPRNLVLGPHTHDVLWIP